MEEQPTNGRRLDAIERRLEHVESSVKDIATKASDTQLIVARIDAHLEQWEHPGKAAPCVYHEEQLNSIWRGLETLKTRTWVITGTMALILAFIAISVKHFLGN